MARYRYKGRFISAGRARQISHLRHAKRHLTSEATHERRTIARTPGYRTDRGLKPVIERAAMARRLAALEAEREQREARIRYLEERIAEEVRLETELSTQTLFGLTPMVDETYWIDTWSWTIADVDDFDENYFQKDFKRPPKGTYRITNLIFTFQREPRAGDERRADSIVGFRELKIRYANFEFEFQVDIPIGPDEYGMAVLERVIARYVNRYADPKKYEFFYVKAEIEAPNGETVFRTITPRIEIPEVRVRRVRHRNRSRGRD